MYERLNGTHDELPAKISSWFFASELGHKPKNSYLYRLKYCHNLQLVQQPIDGITAVKIANN